MKRKLYVSAAFALSLSLAGGFGPQRATSAATLAAASVAVPGPNPIEVLRQETDNKVRIGYNAMTGKVNFIGTDLDHVISVAGAASASPNKPDETALAFLKAYGSLFGLKDADQEMLVSRVKTVDEGAANARTFSRFQQLYLGIPVIGGDVVVQVSNAKNGVVSANGKVVPDIAVSTTPRVSSANAQATARAMVAKKYKLDAAKLTVSEPALWIYNAVVFNTGLNKNNLVWRMDVRAGDLDAVNELVLVDAHLGAVALQFNQIADAKSRTVYDKNSAQSSSLPGTLVRSEGQGPVAGNTDANLAYDYAGSTYDFYKASFNRDSIDGKGLPIISTVRFCPSPTPGETTCPYENAFWNGDQMVYGAGYASADDVVAHELTHGVTQYESHLFYFMQSGGINEALSDVFGEYSDQTNGLGTDTAAVKWQMGEDIPGGAIRSMKDPGLFNDPDRMTSSNYVCGARDSGGVHSNSGIANKAAYLMADGDTFNGETIVGLGIPKASKIWYEAATNLLVSASDYADLGDALQQACVNLAGGQV